MTDPDTKWIYRVLGLGTGFPLGVMVFIALLYASTFGTDAVQNWWADQQARPDKARVEADHLFGRSRDAIERQQRPPRRLTGTPEEDGGGLSRDDILGDYYVLADVVIELEDGRSRLVAVPRNGFYPVLHCDFRDGDDFEITIAQPAGVESMRD